MSCTPAISRAEAEEHPPPAPARIRGLRPDPRRLRPLSNGDPAARTIAGRPGRGVSRHPTGEADGAVPPSRRSTLHRDSHGRGPRQPRSRPGPRADARLDPCRLHLAAGRRRSQERTPQLIRPLTARRPSACPAAAAPDRFPPARAFVLGLAAVLLAVLLLWLNASAGHAAPIVPTPPVAPTDPANPDGGNVNIEINGLDGKPSTAVVTLIGITLLSVAPALLLMMTSFTKIFVVLAMTRNALVAAVHPAQPGARRPGPVPLAVHHVARCIDEMNDLGDPALPERHRGLQRRRRRRIRAPAAVHAAAHAGRGHRPDDPGRRRRRTRPRRRPCRCRPSSRRS